MSLREWMSTPLADHCEIFSGYPFASAEFTDDEADIHLVKGENIGQGEVLWDISKRWPKSQFDDLKRFHLAPGDVVLAMDRPWVPAGLKFAQIGYDAPLALVVQRVARLRACRQLVPAYLPCLIASPQFESYIQNAVRGVTVPHISGKEIGAFRFLLPPVVTQRAIGRVRKDFDDLIDNNRRRIKLLEDSVRLLFNEWFVRLRFPGHDRSTFSDGIPSGWTRSSLHQVARGLEDGDWIESKDQGGEDFRILQISNIGLNDFRETGNLRFITDETFRRLRCREVTPGMILIARMPTPIGRAMMVTDMRWRMVTAVDVGILEPDDDSLDRYVLLYHLNSAENLARCAGRTVGATRPRVTRRELAELPLLIPDKRTQHAFREVAVDVQAQRHVLSRQIEKVRAARDLLLPRLMSGELAV